MANFPFKTLLSLIQKRTFSSSTRRLAPPSSSFTVQYLINSCGLTSNSALSASKKLQLDEKNLKNPDSVLSFFKSIGFGSTHIAKLIENRPQILHSSVDRSLKPKADFLAKNGFEGPLLPEVISKDPFILGRSLNANIKPSFDFLRTCLETNENVVAAVKNFPRLLRYSPSHLELRIHLLKDAGVPVHRIAKSIIIFPRKLLARVDRMARVIQTVKELGFKPESAGFLNAVLVMASMSESKFEKKFGVFKSLGLSEEEIWSAFRAFPHCLAYSEERLKATMDFYVNSVKLKPEVIISVPTLLAYSIDRRIRPRYNVMQVLVANKLLLREDEDVYALSKLLYPSEMNFKKRYIVKYLDQVPNLMEIYRCNWGAKIDV